MDMRITGSLCALLAIACGSAISSAQPTIGAVGDTMTDEYHESGFPYATSWAEQLVLARGLNFGPTAAQANQPGGTWGEPRRTGFRYNWARSGTTNVLIQQGQHTGLAGQANSAAVSFAVVSMGAGDFGLGSGQPYQAIYNQQWTPQQISAHVSQAAANINTVVTELKQAGMRVILVNVPDYGYAPHVKAVYPSADGRQRVTDVLVALNQTIDDIAASHDVMLVDVFGMFQAAFGPHNFTHHTLLIGNREIALSQADSANNTRPWAGFVHDGIHPHTTLQGVTANLILTAINMAYDTDIALLTEEEILAHAGLTYGGFDTLFLEIGDYRDFIVNNACYANCARSTSSPILNVEDFTCFINLFAHGDPRANCDGSTTEPVLNVEDFTCFVNTFAMGCG